ncbi:unnamed protein product [Rhizophagus irregularis]|nr:unnamed protein product [Rhizophagus irregularis]CAB5344595.1 unnamed protein product [Rhizophagus irregularis]
MKQCWDSNSFNRPTITELEDKISEWINCIEANNTLTQKQANISTIVQSHSQAYYTSRNITKILNTENSQEFMIN